VQGRSFTIIGKPCRAKAFRALNGTAALCPLQTAEKYNGIYHPILSAEKRFGSGRGAQQATLVLTRGNDTRP
jgi:hypothetical protein